MEACPPALACEQDQCWHSWVWGCALTQQGSRTPHAQLHADGQSEATHGSEVEDKSVMWTPLLGENMAGELSSL